MVGSVRARHSCAVAALLAWVAIPASATIIIDPFTTSQSLSVGSRAGNVGQGPVVVNSTAANAPLALGGQRELYYSRLYGSSSGGVNVNLDNFEAATFKTGSLGVANALLVYDGASITTGLGASGAVGVVTPGTLADAKAKVNNFRFGAPDAYGLTTDLTENGVNDRIRLSAYADNQGTQVVLRFFLSGTKYAEKVLTIPGSPDFQYKSYDILFNDFVKVGFGVNENVLDAFSGVKAITMQFNGVESTDASFDFFAATTAVPEPVSTSLVGGGLCLLGCFCTRRKSRSSKTR